MPLNASRKTHFYLFYAENVLQKIVHVNNGLLCSTQNRLRKQPAENNIETMLQKRSCKQPPKTTTTAPTLQRFERKMQKKSKY